MKHAVEPGAGLRAYGLGVAVTAFALVLDGLVQLWIAERMPFLFFLPALTLVAATIGRGELHYEREHASTCPTAACAGSSTA